MKTKKFIVVLISILVLSFSSDANAQNYRKKVWDAAKKAWIWVEKEWKPKPRRVPRVVTVTCNQCSGYGKVRVNVPVTVWNPYYQCYQTQYQTQIRDCSRCYGSGKKTITY